MQTWKAEEPRGARQAEQAHPEKVATARSADGVWYKKHGLMGPGFQEPCGGHNCLEPCNWRWEEQDWELSQEAAPK